MGAPQAAFYSTREAGTRVRLTSEPIVSRRTNSMTTPPAHPRMIRKWQQASFRTKG